MKRAMLIRFILVALLAPCVLAHAQSYPARSIRIVVPYAAGGGSDITRVTGQKMAESWGQQIIVDNRAGADGNIGTEIVAKSAPDGTTTIFTFPFKGKAGMGMG